MAADGPTVCVDFFPSYSIWAGIARGSSGGKTVLLGMTVYKFNLIELLPPGFAVEYLEEMWYDKKVFWFGQNKWNAMHPCTKIRLAAVESGILPRWKGFVPERVASRPGR